MLVPLVSFTDSLYLPGARLAEPRWRLLPPVTVTWVIALPFELSS